MICVLPLRPPPDTSIGMRESLFPSPLT